MPRVQGKVALITGGAWGQGRSHALRLAEEGADIVLIDACTPISAVNYDFPTVAELEETAAMVEKLDRRVIAHQVDVRDQAGLDRVVAHAVEEFGGIDIVVANAGIAHIGTRAWELTDEQWQTTIDINLTGVWRTIKAALPPMIERGVGGSVILISSVAGSKGIAAVSHYVAAKHGVIGMAKSLANELGEHRIRVNCIQPGNVETPMTTNEHSLKLFRPDLPAPTLDDVREVMATFTSLPVDLLEPVDISNAVLWLASDEARYVTGISIPVDAGWINR